MNQKGLAYLYLLLGILLLVLVGGGAYYFGTKQSQPQITSLVTQLSPTGSVDQTANWQIYTNTAVGFSIKYPQRYSTPTFNDPNKTLSTVNGKEDNTIIWFESNIDDNISLQVFPYSGKVEDLPAYKPVPFIDNLNISSPSEVTVNGQKGLMYLARSSSTSLTTSKIYFTENNHGFIAEANLGHSDQELKEMISTFTFTNQTQTVETTGWNVYLSKSGNYSFNYPKDWQATENIVPHLNKTIPVVSIKTPGSFNGNPDYAGAGEEISIIVYDNTNNLKLEDFIKANINNDQYTYNFILITIANTNGEKLINLPGAFQNENIYIARGSNVYQIEWLKGQTKQLPISEVQFNQILSTFKFTN